MLQAFDAPDGVLSCSRRNESTTAPQSLALLNSGFMMEQAKAIAAKMGDIDTAWQRILGRAPSNEERTAAQEFLRRNTMADLARGLLNLNEFLYVD